MLDETDRAQAVLQTALEMASAAERSAFLDEACAGDPALRRRVEALLTGHEAARGRVAGQATAEGHTRVLPPIVRGNNGVVGVAQTPEGCTRVLPPGPTQDPTRPSSATSDTYRERVDPATASSRKAGPHRAILPARPVWDTATLPTATARSDRATLPGYDILAELGRGGMGVVYKARHIRLQRLVALKMILAGAYAGPVELARFRTEAEAVAQVQHPHIVQIYEIGEHDGLPYFALEFVEGGGLDQKTKGTPQLPQAAAALVETLARTMHSAHEHGIVHRDLKPANILLTTAETETSLGNPKIADFGLAKRLDNDSQQTRSGTVVGTPSYMAPEQALGQTRTIGPPADIYALGSILYELLTGRPPFKASTPFDTVRQVIEQEPVPPRQLQPRIPRDLETICLKCLQKESPKRYASALALADDLQRFLHGEPILARPVSAWERGIKWARRRPVAAALVAVAALAVVSLVGGAVLYGENQRHARREMEYELEETRRTGTLRGRVEQALDKVRAALAGRNWPAADAELREPEGLIQAEATLTEYRAAIAALRRQAAQGLVEQQEREAAHAHLQRFIKGRDDTLFYASQFTGLDLPANQQSTRTAARQALEAFGPVGKLPTLVVEHAKYFTEAETSGLLADAYALLLTLAEAVSHPLADEDRRRQAALALPLLDVAAQLRPPTRAFYLARADCLTAVEDPAGAAAARSQADALKATPSDVVDAFLLGLESYRRQDLAAALTFFREAVRLQPDHFWAHYLMAICYLQTARPDQAESCLTHCQDRRPGFVWIYILRGFVYGELGARALAAGQAAEAALSFAAASTDFQRAQQFQPTGEAAYVLLVNRGVTHYRQKQYAEAIHDLEAAIRLKPDQYQAHVNLAEVYQDQHTGEQALVQLDEAIRLQPQLAALHRARARLHQERHDASAAVHDYEEALRLEAPGSHVLAEDQTERGRILHEQQQYAEALLAYDAALEIDPNHAPAQRYRGAALLELKRYPEAVEAFDRAVKKSKPDAALFEARGLARARLQEQVGAIADYSRALDLDPRAKGVYAHRGWTYLVAEAPRLALADFEKVLMLDSDCADGYNGRGFARVKLGQTREAVADAEKALQQSPATPRLVYNAARIYAQAAGRQDLQTRALYQERAIQLVRRALELLPGEQRLAFWRDCVEVDGALAPISQSAGFLQLASGYMKLLK